MTDRTTLPEDPEPTPPSPPTLASPLVVLARLCGIQVEYVDTSGTVQHATDASLVAVLRALGINAETPEAIHRALLDRQLQTWRRAIEPVIVVWDGSATRAELRTPEALTGVVACHLLLESGSVHEWSTPLDALTLVGSSELAGERFVARELPLPEGLPTGYHRLTVRLDNGTATSSTVIAAPTRAYDGATGHGEESRQNQRLWGLFCPLFALHSATSWGAGDHSDLETLMDWTAKLGGNMVATLPMLATSFDGANPHISPYSPTSRLFWNEFYLDLRRIPELSQSSAARGLLDSAEVQGEVADLQSRDLVHYGRQMRLKRRILEYLADAYFDAQPDGTPEFQTYIADHPDAEAYAWFQAMGERFGRDWRQWPTSADPHEVPNRVDQRAVQYHLYAQWQTDIQLTALAAKAERQGLTWYLDFPIGVDFHSFDVWRNRDSFATGASVGCPPDLVFTKGQNWGFPPLHPDRQREDGYSYLIASFRNHLRYANALRIDHVMGLHRLFWIPDGAEAKYGAYVATPADEIYAILSVESHRRQAWLVGEDLGTVPPAVESALNRHAVAGMYVVQYELRPEPALPLRPVPKTTVASVNTHDMPPFAAYWTGLDLLDRQSMGLLEGDALLAESTSRIAQREALVNFLKGEGKIPATAGADDTGAALAGIWRWLAVSPSRVVLLNVEDLWLETESQNTPNTSTERANWQRKLRHSLEAITANPDFNRLLAEVDAGRKLPIAAKADPDRVDVEALPIAD